jgi:hypothetical protein
MTKQQTAVEWLRELYDGRPAYEEFIDDEEWDKAIEMEREQIINAHGRGIIEHSGFPSPLTSEEYYGVTYDKTNSA